MWLLSTPALAALLMRQTAIETPDLDRALAGSSPADTAIVVLGGGARPRSGNVTPRELVSGGTASRVITAARVFKERDAGTVVVTGADTEAEPMSDLLLALGVPKDRIVLDDRSRNTRDNAANTAKILRTRGVSTTILVTSSIHLKRSLREFAAVGLTAIPVAADSLDFPPPSFGDFLPSVGGLGGTAGALHELLGLFRPRFGGV